jgi:PAS domain S-box-containing protein
VFYVTGADAGERTVHAGPEVRSLFGFDAAVWRSSPRLWAERVHPEDQARVLAEIRRVSESPGSFTLEYRLLGRDGTAVWVRDTGTSRRDGGDVRITGFLLDVTEVKSLHDRLLQSGQLDAAARVASGVARDVEDLAAAVERHARAVLPKVEEDAVQRGHVEGILRAAERGASLAADLRAFGGAQRLAPEPVMVNPAVERLLPEIRHAAGPTVEVATLLAPGVRPAWVDPAGLDQAVLRLAAHVARGLREDRRRAGGKLTIGTLDVTLDEAAARRSGVAAGSYVLLAFGEGGAAPGPADAARTFQPFGEAESPPGPGRRDAGLLLASVFGFARQSGGTAEVAGEPGRPSAWRLLLPCPA